MLRASVDRPWLASRYQAARSSGTITVAATSSTAHNKKAVAKPASSTTNPIAKPPIPVPASKATFHRVLPVPYSAFDTRLDRTVAVTFGGPVDLVRAALPYLRESRGTIVATTGVRHLEAETRDAVLAHERAHLSGRHHALVLVVTALGLATYDALGLTG